MIEIFCSPGRKINGFEVSKVNKSGTKSNRDFHCHAFNAIYFCLHVIFPFSKSCPEIESTWPTAKCNRRKSFDTWYYIVTCATLCVNFSSKSKPVNVFLKTYSQIKSTWPINSSKEAIVLSRDNKELFVQHFSWKFLIKIKNT